ncbi:MULTISPECIES: hypothetical protein [unclassified Streptomyces]|uniref:hypothetical protein n=1 Tax=unclassified Streptomyces TaxID=2593676 RepID=UPI002F90E7B9
MGLTDSPNVGSRQQLGNYVNFRLGNYASVHKAGVRAGEVLVEGVDHCRPAAARSDVCLGSESWIPSSAACLVHWVSGGDHEHLSYERVDLVDLDVRDDLETGHRGQT